MYIRSICLMRFRLPSATYDPYMQEAGKHVKTFWIWQL